MHTMKTSSFIPAGALSCPYNSASLPMRNPVIVQSSTRRAAPLAGHPSPVTAAISASSSSTASLLGRSLPRPGPRHAVIPAAQSGRSGKGGGGADEEPDWEAEMSIFMQRISRPNQLATLRELEAKTSVGKVLYARDGLAIVAGLNTDAPLGTQVSFATGTAGVLLWHRSDNLSFCLVLGDPASVVEGTPVECKIKGVLQVVDDVTGPITRKDFQTFNVPTGEEVFGRVQDHIGRHLPQYDTDSTSVSTSTGSTASDGVAAAAAAAAPVSMSAPAGPATTPPASRSGNSGSGGGGGGGSGGRPRPLVNQQVEMKNREQIAESLLTGVKGLDILTPVGRGASLLVIGPGGAGKTRLALDAVAAQARWAAAAAAAAAAAGTAAAAGGGPAAAGGAVEPAPPGGPVRCVLALVGRPQAEVAAVLGEMRAAGSLANTAVVVAAEGAPLGHQYAAMCCACAIGERVRDEGGHALVLVDDVRPLSDLWEALLGGLAGLGAALLREGLVKDERGRDVPVVPLPGSPATAAGAIGPAATPSKAGPATTPSGAAAAGPSGAAAVGGFSISSGGGSGISSGGDSGDDDALVEYEGMLVSGAVAQRRGFLSTFFMRAAKLSRSLGGGSMSLLPLVPGTCATGVSKRIDMSKYKTLSPEQLAKLEAALRAKQLAEELSSGPGAGELATEVVEEFISIADGQVVLRGPAAGGQQGSSSSSSSSPSSSPSGPRYAYTVDPKLSITRIGTRAYYKALEQLAPQVRLDLAQADDARRFGAAATSTSSSTFNPSGSSLSSLDPGPSAAAGAPGSSRSDAGARADALARRLEAALLQEPGRPAGLAEQVTTLYAVQKGFADAVPPDQVPAWLRAALPHVAASAPAAWQELGHTGLLTAEAEATISVALRRFSWAGR